ncbi:HNH endonuclease [Qipengyuania psychrotolerans]|uniref:HNH endonuclease n=1 Tax=Qipengyuania psychrotolerans TaxID=2867238 RepID=A0ABX8ZCX4_9SPHN|nr:HNH endonuclease [Qipengyuania psychrotolerans]QZD86835.1 HNH endonuclease [Qipengyuania psychrotolerans]
MARWNRTSKWKKTMIARLLERDGFSCWLCGLPMTQPPKKHNKRISLEHLKARSEGGTDDLDNLVLCHQHCNGHLGVRPIADKLKMRSKWHKVATRAHLLEKTVKKR